MKGAGKENTLGKIFREAELLCKHAGKTSDPPVVQSGVRITVFCDHGQAADDLPVQILKLLRLPYHFSFEVLTVVFFDILHLTECSSLADCMNQMVMIERLVDEIEGPAFQGANRHLGLCECRHDQHGEIRVLLMNYSCQFDTIHTGHLDVGKYNLYLPVAQPVKRLRCVGSSDHMIVMGTKHQQQRLNDMMI